VLLVLVKLIRDVALLVEKEKQEAFQEKDRIGSYAEAIVVYLYSLT
jgi:adenine-specific DNA methylase